MVTIWPVKTVVVEVPAVLVTVREAVKTPPSSYVWEVVGIVVVTGRVPSPKFHLYVAMLPTGEEEPEPSKKTVEPLMEVIKDAVGAWSGVMETP